MSLQAMGLGRLSDTLVAPISTAARGILQPRTIALTYRGNRHDYWLRSADVPFELLPNRPLSCSEAHGVFTLGPGMTNSGSSPNVLQVEIFGESQYVLALEARVSLLKAVASEWRVSRATSDPSQGSAITVCIASVIDGTSCVAESTE